MTALSDFSDHEDEILAEYENEDDERDHKNLSNIDTEEQGENVSRRIDPSTSHKHITRNPIPTLNTQRLKGPKGIHTIEKHFEGFKFHGKGSEKMDLDRVMKRLEHWAHRLFPKLHFDDFLERTEKLGSKKDLSVFITKYRNDMITPEEDETFKNNVSDEEHIETEPPVDAFDLLIAEQIEKQKEALVRRDPDKEDTFVNNDANDIFLEASEQCSTTRNEKTIEISNSQRKNVELSDEIKERIERNRQQAIERKLAKLKAMQEDAKKKEMEKNADTEI